MKIRVVKKGVGTELKDCGDADFEIWTVMDQEDLDKFFSNESVMSLIGLDGSKIISFKALEEGGKYGLGAGKAQAVLKETPVTGPKRPLQEEVFCYAPKRVKHATSEITDEKVAEGLAESHINDKKRPVMEPLTEYLDAARFTFTNNKSFIWFGIQQYVKPLEEWILHLFHPTSSVQQKQLLLVHGAVKSGKTTLIRFALPHLLCQLQASMLEFQDKTFCFAYIDLSPLSHLTSVEEKWKTFMGLLMNAFPGRMNAKKTELIRWHLEVQAAIQELKNEGDALWFISLDEFHHLFSGLGEEQVANMAEISKHIFLDNDSPCHFLLGGSTQATFWSAVGKAKNNGIQILREAHIITTPFESTNMECFDCATALEAEGVGTSEIIDSAMKLLSSQLTVVNLTQAVLIASQETGTPEEKARQAYDKFLRAKQSVFLRDYTDLPDPTMVNAIIGWANGSSARPPELYSHLLSKRGNAYYIRDADFKAFLAQHYDEKTGRIQYQGGDMPIMDIMMFIRLLPLGQRSKEGEMDDVKFQARAKHFADDHFDGTKHLQFVEWLIYGPDRQRCTEEKVNINYTYAKKALKKELDPATAPWPVVVRMLRNIFGHQKDIKWQSLSLIKDHVLSYMKTALNFNELIKIYEECSL